MKVIFPYTRTDAKTMLALPLDAVLVPLPSPPDDKAYGRLLAAEWALGKGFINVEHDVVLRPDTIALLTACPFQWCTWAYPFHDPALAPLVISDRLGCVKFSETLVQAIPDVMILAAAIQYTGRDWMTLDRRVVAVLRHQYGLWPHVHGIWDPLEHRDLLHPWRVDDGYAVASERDLTALVEVGTIEGLHMYRFA